MTGPWLIAGQRPQEPAGQRLRELIRRPGIVRVPGAHDGLTAQLARRAGFKCLYLSGAALSASMALPDLGVISQDELVHASRMICRAAGLPLIVDGDTGYGEALNVMRLVAELEQSG